MGIGVFMIVHSLIEIMTTQITGCNREASVYIRFSCNCRKFLTLTGLNYQSQTALK